MRTVRSAARRGFYIVLAIALLVGAMLLPFFPGRYDPVATIGAVIAGALAFGGLLLVPIGVVWLIARREYGVAKAAVAAATFVAAGTALVTAAASSVVAAAIVFAGLVMCLAHLWRRVRAAEATAAELSRAIPVALIVVPLLAAAAGFVLAEPAAVWSRDRVIANAAPIIADIERYRERSGSYPVALSSLWPDYRPGVMSIERYRYEPSGEAYNLYFEHLSTIPGVREIVMYNPRGEQDFSSHAVDLLQLSPADIRRQRGYFAAHDLSQTNWRRFLFD